MLAYVKSANADQQTTDENATEASPAKGTGNYYILLAIPSLESTVLRPGKLLGAHVVAGGNLDVVRQHAQGLLRQHAYIDRVSVLDADGSTLLGIATRSAIGWEAPRYPRLGFH